MADWSNATFRKSSTSSSGGCVEVAQLNGLIGVRDTKAHGTGPVLEFTQHEWARFLEGARGGEFEPEALA